jgi:hypothetical protein
MDKPISAELKAEIYAACLAAAKEMGASLKTMSWFASHRRFGQLKKAA